MAEIGMNGKNVNDEKLLLCWLFDISSLIIIAKEQIQCSVAPISIIMIDLRFISCCGRVSW